MAAPSPRAWPSLALVPAALLLQVVATGIFVAALGTLRGVAPADLPAWIQRVQGSAAGLLALALPSQAAYLALAVLVGLVSRRPLVERLALRPPRPLALSLLLALLGSAALAVALEAVGQALIEEPGPHLRSIAEAITSARGGWVVALVLVLSLAPGLSEELFFRGMLQSRLTQAWGARAGVLVASSCFALAHLDPQHVLLVLPVGLWLGALAWLTGSVLPAMLAHAVHNALSILLARALEPAQAGAREAATLPVGWSALALVTLAAAVLLARARGRPTPPRSPGLAERGVEEAATDEPPGLTKAARARRTGGMPLYEYVCESCAHPFEELVLGDERPLCPACGGARLAKRFSTFAVAEEAAARPSSFAGPGACGTCGDPRGPGSCAR